MTERVDWLPADTLPDRQDVLHLQGVPPGTMLPSRIEAIVDAASAIYLETAEPRALVAGISHETFAAIFRGEGRNAPETPIEKVAPRAQALTLFVATVGGGVTERIQQLFAENEPALAAMLDSVASAAADRLADLLAMRERVEDDDAEGRQSVSLGYSPGYCGWHVSGQRALFDFLRPGAIGVTLNASCLMDPLKSVSGVLAAGPPEIHNFHPGYPFCADCRDKPCLGRIRPQSRPAPAP